MIVEGFVKSKPTSVSFPLPVEFVIVKLMAFAGDNYLTTMDLSEVTCAFCMDVFENPHRISCGHT